jgi:alkylation response protein AidB-like acyl-CoA dehydrogenase
MDIADRSPTTDRRRTPAQVALAGEVRAALAEIPPVPAGLGLEDRFAALVAFERRLHHSRLAVVSWPERYGGRGLGPEDASVVAEELGRCRAPELINFVAIEVIAPALMRFANDEQRARWLSPMGPAEEIWCQLFSEPDAGSDLAALGTRAVPEGVGFVVSGQKVWSTWAQFSRWGLLLARTGSTESRHRGISAFVVDMSLPGIEVRPLTTMTGDAEFAEVHFDRVVLPPDSLVGELHGGWAVAMHMLGNERGPYAIRRASVVRSMVQDVLSSARSAELSSVHRHRVVDVYIKLVLLDLRIAQVVNQLSAGHAPGPEAAITKVLLTNAEQAACAARLDSLGVGGIALRPGDQEGVALRDAYLYSRAASIYGGSVQVQRNIISERLLGLPADARPG